MKYWIVEDDNSDSVQEQVNDLLSNGWKLYVNLVVVQRNNTNEYGESYTYLWYVQAMVKEESNCV